MTAVECSKTQISLRDDYMKQWLPRGFEICSGSHIIKLLAGDTDWQLYCASHDHFALVVSSNQYNDWISHALICSGVFCEIAENRYLYSCPHSYLLSSLISGPYPETGLQVEAFSIAFGNFQKNHPDLSIDDGCYIEEHSLILPFFSTTTRNMDVVYGHFLAGGISISASDTNRFEHHMSWINGGALHKYMKSAGFSTQNEKNETMEVTDNSGSCKLPDESFHLVGRPELELFFNDNIVDIIKKEEAYSRMGIGFPGATVLYGPPGFGKTYAVERLAEYLSWPKFSIDSSSVASPYIHDTAKKIAEVFDSAIKSAPSILIIDEMESFLSSRTDSSTGTHHVEEVAEFLRRIPEALEKHVLIFAMTNVIESIDKAILRKGRFDHIIEVKMASKEEIESLLHYKIKDLPISDDVNIEHLSETLAGHPLSDVTYLIREAGRIAVKQHMQYISMSCFTTSLSNLGQMKEERRKIGFQ